MRKILHILTAFCCWLVCANSISAQDTSRNETTSPAYKTILKNYFEAVGQNSPIYTGPEYAYYGNNMEGSPFLVSDAMVKGDIVFDGLIYADMLLNYDVVYDQLIITRFKEDIRIRPVPEKVDAFSFGERQFVRLLRDSGNSILSTGYYERLYEGNTHVYAKRKKKMEKVMGGSRFSFRLLNDDSYFILKDGVYHAVKNKAAALNVFADKKKLLSQFIRKARLEFKDDPAHALVGLAAQYDQLN